MSDTNIYTEEFVINTIEKIDPLFNKEIAEKYYNFLKQYSSREYDKDEICQDHHILPRSLFPEYIKDESNIINLSTVHHLKCHEMLSKIFSNFRFKGKMMYAYNGMLSFSKSITCEHCFKKLDILHYVQHHGDYCKENPNRDVSNSSRFILCEYCNKQILTTNYKMWHGEYCKENPKRIESPYKKGRKKPRKIFCEYCNKYIPSNGFQYHGEYCKENPKRIIRPKIKRKIATCKWCKKQVDTSNLNKWHNDYCKENPNRKINKIKCKYCNKEFDPQNYSRWHGENCKFKGMRQQECSCL